MPQKLQRIVDEFMQTGKLRFYSGDESVASSRTSPEPPMTVEASADALIFGDEKFIVVG